MADHDLDDADGDPQAGVAVVACVGVLIAMAIATVVHVRAKDPIALAAGGPIFFVLGLVALVTI